MIHPDYPTPSEIDAWCEEILTRAEKCAAEPRRVEAESYSFALGVRHVKDNGYLAFPSVAPLPPTKEFHCYWQPAAVGPAPMLFHVPGYGAEMSAHPVHAAQGFHVLHINPLGYATPKGPVAPVIWPVMPDTVRSFGEKGYVDWLTDAAIAVRWALAQPNVQKERFAFFGTSQGGGGALLLASVFSRLGCRAVAADEPYLTHFPRAYERGRATAAHNMAFGPLDALPEPDKPRAWRAIGFVDTMSHAHRLTMPTLLTAGGADGVCPPYTIEPLFEALPGTRSFTLMANERHGYTVPFGHLSAAWFRLYV